MELLKFDRKSFEESFGSKSDCYAYLAEQKWVSGYECRRCKATKYIKGKQPFSRRCSKCGYDESATAS